MTEESKTPRIEIGAVNDLDRTDDADRIIRIYSDLIGDEEKFDLKWEFRLYYDEDTISESLTARQDGDIVHEYLRTRWEPYADIDDEDAVLEEIKEMVKYDPEAQMEGVRS